MPESARRMLELVTDAAEIGTWNWNLETGEVEWNAWHSHFFGFPHEPSVRSYEEFSTRVHPEDAPALEAAVQEALQGGGLFQRAYRLVLPDGYVRHVRGQGRLVPGTPPRMVGVVIDITEGVLAARRERDLLRGLAEADERARRSVAAEIHDGPLQQLFVAKLSGEGALRALQRDGVLDASSSPRLERVVGAVERAQAGLRSLLVVLVPPEIDGPVDLRETLQRLAEDVFTGVDQRIEVVADDVAVVPSELARVALPILGEALMNVRKHAGSRAVRVVVSSIGTGVAVDVRDDGQGFDVTAPAVRGHYGRSVMAGRAAAAGGTLHTTSTPGGGTTVRLTLPMAREGVIPAL